MDVVELKGSLAVDLHDGFPGRHRVMVHVGIQKREAPGRERLHLIRFKSVSHPHLELSGDDRHVFPQRVPMRRDAETVGHLQPNCVVAAGPGRIALEYGELGARLNNGWRWTPGNGIRGDRVCFMRIGDKVVAEKFSSTSENPCNRYHV